MAEGGARETVAREGNTLGSVLSKQIVVWGWGGCSPEGLGQLFHRLVFPICFEGINRQEDPLGRSRKMPGHIGFPTQLPELIVICSTCMYSPIEFGRLWVLGFHSLSE